MAANINMCVRLKTGHVRGYLFSDTKAVLWIHCKCEIPAYIIFESPGVNQCSLEQYW